VLSSFSKEKLTIVLNQMSSLWDLALALQLTTETRGSLISPGILQKQKL